jgi:hypothetical protein
MESDHSGTAETAPFHVVGKRPVPDPASAVVSAGIGVTGWQNALQALIGVR